MVLSSEPVTGVAAWAVDLMERLGAPGAGLAVALENLFPPLPSEVILPLAGFTASRGDMSLAGAILWTTAGSLAGAVALYLVGALLGPDRVRAVAARLPLVRVADVDRTEAWFARHGTKAVLLGRMIPIFRSLVSIPAGITRMPMAVFLALTALGSLVWNTAFVLAGYALGESWWRVEAYAGVFQKAVLLAVAVAAVLFVVTRLRRRRAAYEPR
jgi:membrane protein DedA with SNARE-associated domain